jgi:SAM-dependent methyltransferase
VTIDPASAYSSRLEAYARFRWPYAPAAIDRFAEACGLAPDWVAADIGSGTGMLTEHLVDRVQTVYAVEPNPDMREMARLTVGAAPAFHEVNGTSDRTTLPDRSVTLIAVGRALHWFPPETTNAEFRRILTPGGWLAIFGTPCTDHRLLDSLRTLEREEYGWNPAGARFHPHLVPAAYYFGHDDLRTVREPRVVHETFEMLLGRISSHLATPPTDHPLRARYEAAAREIFDHHAVDGLLTIPIVTEIVFGQLAE